MKGLKIQIDKGVDGVLNFFTSNTKEDFNKAPHMSSHGVTADKIVCYELSEADTKYFVSMGCKELDENIIGIEQCYMDYSESGKIKCMKRTHTRTYDANEVGYDDSLEDIQYPLTEVLTAVDTVMREMIGTLVV